MQNNINILHFSSNILIIYFFTHQKASISKRILIIIFEYYKIDSNFEAQSLFEIFYFIYFFIEKLMLTIFLGLLLVSL